jgi:Tol biopolymer transport system component
MIKGKRFSVAHMDAQNQAEYLADKLWPLLTGQEGIFATRIVFCKEVMTEEKKIAKNICLTPPYAFPNENSYQLITKNLIEKGRVFAPRWNRDTENPLVLFSESTLSNVRLVSVNLQKQRSIVSNFEGLNILPSFSCDGKRVIYCLSRNGKSQLYLYEFDKESDQPILREITNNNGNNISPTLCENGDIVFCSDFQSKGPQICYYHAFTEQIEVLTSGGYCACPTFCEKNGKIAYSKYVDGILQIFIYDTKTRQHAQITTDKGNKEECTWSPCGNYLAFAVDYGSACRIAVLNLITNERSFITGEKERCMYPCWSPRYAAPLVVAA